ncbi:hypothetical protein CsSME_00014224 [Camellia sinensis var. sinensis]
MSSLSDNLNSPSLCSHVTVLNINLFQKSTQGNDEMFQFLQNFVSLCVTNACLNLIGCSNVVRLKPP